jgi:hypothetical protein
MRSVSTGKVVPKTCKSWLCPHCNVWLREGARKLIVSGMQTRPPGTDLALFTFTEPAHATLDLAGFKRRHDDTIRALRRRGWLVEYCTAVEFQKRGALHPHVIAHVPVDVLERMPEHGQAKRDRAQYRWHFNELVPLARSLGWGPMVDARAAVASNDLAMYALKNLAGYATKEAYTKFKAAGARRVRPLRTSRSWASEKLREAQRGEKATDGPWEDVTAHGPCR